MATIPAAIGDAGGDPVDTQLMMAKEHLMEFAMDHVSLPTSLSFFLSITLKMKLIFTHFAESFHGTLADGIEGEVRPQHGRSNIGKIHCEHSGNLAMRF
jgi:hypothetical protein